MIVKAIKDVIARKHRELNSLLTCPNSSKLSMSIFNIEKNTITTSNDSTIEKNNALFIVIEHITIPKAIILLVK